MTTFPPLCRTCAQCCQCPQKYFDDAYYCNASPRCNGECGAAEEHIMDGVGHDMILSVKAEEYFSIADRIPLFAGLAADGSTLYIASTHCAIFIEEEIVHTVTNGARPKDLKCRTYFADGSSHDNDLYPHKDDEMLVYCLQYDPYVCYPSPRYNGMDATGPYSWQRYRTFYHWGCERGNDYFARSRPLWSELIHEPKSEAQIQEVANDHVPIDHDNALVSHKMIQEANVSSVDSEQAAHTHELTDIEFTIDTALSFQEVPVTEEANVSPEGLKQAAHIQEFTGVVLPIDAVLVLQDVVQENVWPEEWYTRIFGGRMKGEVIGYLIVCLLSIVISIAACVLRVLL